MEIEQNPVLESSPWESRSSLRISESPGAQATPTVPISNCGVLWVSVMLQLPVTTPHHSHPSVLKCHPLCEAALPIIMNASPLYSHHT